MLGTVATTLLLATGVPAPPPGWHRIYADGFDTPSATFPTAGWGAYPSSYHDTSGHGTYNCSTACSVGGGNLWLHLHGPTVAAPLPKLPVLREGRYTVRFQVPAATANTYKIAWLLWPDTPQGGATARDGEIDFPETDTLPGTIAAHTHWRSPSSNSDQESFHTGATTASWHTATIERTQSRISYILDGATIGTSTGNRLPTEPMHWVLQSETRLDGPAPAATASADILIDYVTVEQPGDPVPAAPQPAPSPPPVVPPPDPVITAPELQPPQGASSWCG